MRNFLTLLLMTFFMGTWVSAQVKIGDNPQNIDPSSVLELESTDKVLVITRVTTTQMNAIVPIQGALCYNTDLQSVHYFDGVQWVNIGGGAGTGGPLTADPIVNAVSTIVITPTGTGDNLEVAPNSIRSEQIIDGGINGVDIQDGSIGPGKLQNDSVTEDKLSENSVGEDALDSDNIGVSIFTNDAGYITGANVVSGDTGNALQIGTDSGAFYDETPLMTSIQNNTDAINAIGTPNLNEVLQQGNNALTLTIEGLGTPVNPADAATKAYVDAAITAGGGNPTDELQDLNFDLATNILTLTTPATGGNQVDLSSLAGGGGNQNLTNVLTQGNDANGLQIVNLADPTLAQDAATKAYVDANGGNQNLGQVLTQGNDGGAALVKNILDPVDNQDAATKAYVDAAVLAGGNLTDGSILIGGVGNVAQQLAVAGDATLANDGTLTIVNNAVNTGKIENATILAEDLAQNGATDGQILKWNNTTTAWEVSDDDTGTATLTDGNIFVGGAGDVPTDVTISGDATIDNLGALTLADDAVELNNLDQMGATDGQILRWNNTSGEWETGDAAAHFGTANSVFFADAATGAPTEDNASFAWAPTIRLGTGQLQIGLEGNTAPTDVSKVVIAETPSPGADVMFPLLVQTSAPASANASTGILFSPETHGPGTLAKGALIYQRTGPWAIGDFHFLQTSLPNLVKPTTADKAFTVRNNKDIVIYGGIEIDGIGLGANGDVLTSTGATVQWAAPSGGAVSTDATINGDGSATPLSVANDAITTARILDGEVQTLDIADNNVTPAKIAEGINGQVLTTDAAGDVIWAAPTAGAVSTDATINGDGSATPLSVANDAITTARILDGEVQTLDIADNNVTPAKIAEGINGQVLTTDAAGDVIWAAPTAGAVSTDATINGDGSATPLSVANDAITTARILDGEVQTVDIADGAIVGGLGGVIADNSITASDIQNDAVDSGEIRIDAVGASEIQTGAVETDEILDGTIQNIDVSPTAAIDGAKINPNFGTQNIVTMGDVSGNSFISATMTYPDYVFQKYFKGDSEIDPLYRFQTLHEIEQFVKQHHHLPGIKSFAEIQMNKGKWNITQGALKNLEKIEELFLHTIEQEKKIKTLQSDKESLLDELGQMKKEIEAIKALLKEK